MVGFLVRGLRLGLIWFAVLAYLALVGLPARIGGSAAVLFALVLGLMSFVALRRKRGGVGSAFDAVLLSTAGGVVAGVLLTLLMVLFATLIGSGVRVQPVLDKITPPNVAAWFNVQPIAIVRNQWTAVDAALPPLWFALAGAVGGWAAWFSRRQAASATVAATSNNHSWQRWLVIVPPFLLFALVVAMGDPAVMIGGNDRGIFRLLFALAGVALGLLAVRAARRGVERTGVALLLGLAVALLPFTLDQFQNSVMGIVFIFVMIGLGLNIVVGFAGLLDLGYVAFFAIGAYVYAFIAAPFSSPWFSQQLAALGLPTSQPLLSFWQAIPPVLISGAIGGILLGIPVLRLRGDYLAIVTLGFGEIIRLFMLNLSDLTNGPRGLLNIASPKLFGYDLGNPRDMFILALLGSAVVAFIAFRLEQSRIGRAWVAMREDEDAAQAMGIHLVRAKLTAFAIGATCAGLAGQLYAARQVNIFPDNFTLFVSIDALALVIVGGMGSIPGVVLGAIALKGLPEVLRGVDEYRIVLFAALLVVMMIARPEGILPSERRRLELHSEEGKKAIV